MSYNAINKYQQNTVTTATPEELTLMLYNGALKFMNIGKLSIEDKDIQKKHEAIVRAQAIITELRATLDMDFEISNELDAFYSFILDKLLDANIGMDLKALDEAIEVTTDLRDTWKEAMATAKKSMHQAR